MVTPAAAIARLGTETAFEVLARAQALAAQGRDVINLGIGQPDFATPPAIVEAAIEALRAGHHGYTPAAGIAPLREAVAAEIARTRGVTVPTERIMILPGGKVTMWFAILMVGEPGAEIVYPDPGFPIYRSAIAYTGATPVPLPLKESDGFGFSAADVLARVTPATRMIVLNSPANPTGGVTPAAEMDALAAGLADRPDIVLLSDEIYSRMLYDGQEPVSPLAYESLAPRTIVLDGWSKTYAMTGWRLGWSVWPDAMIDGAVRLAVNSHSCVNAAAQWAGLAALTGDQAPVDAMVAAFADRRRVIVDGLNALPGVRCIEPGGAFYAFPNITGTGLSARTLQHRLLEEAGVATIAGPSFGDAGEGYLRFSYAASVAAIETALERVDRFLRHAV